MVKILVTLLLFTGLTLNGSMQLELDESNIKDIEEFYRIMQVRSLAVEFSEYFANITRTDLEQPYNRIINQQDLQCLADMSRLMNGLSARKLWALKMIDSWGTLPRGLLYGNKFDLGNYDECIATNQWISDKHTLMAKYCFIDIPVPGRRFSLNTAVCFPASCSTTNMDIMLRKLIKQIYNIKVSKPLVSEDSCRTSEPESQDALFIFTVVILAILIAAVFFATCYDYLWCEDQTRLPVLVKIFSARVNSRALFRLVEPQSNPNVIDCLYGMRCMSLIWVIFGHQYLFALMAPNINQFRIKWWIKKPFPSFILHASFSVDTFFFLSGMLLVMIALRSMQKTQGKLNILMMYVHRYLRLTPIVALAILLYMKILPLFGDGPMFQNVMFDDYNHCKRTWFWTLLYLQNYATPDLCINHSWYLAVDMQLYIISPIFLISLYKWGKKAAGGIFVLMLLLSACLFSTMMTEKYPIYVQNGVTPDAAQRKLYYATHTHAAPWLIGVLFGYFLHVTRNKSFKLNHIYIWIGWIICLAVIFTAIFALLPYVDYLNPTLPMLNQAFYYTFTRMAWPLSLCWVVFACMRGYGGLANSFLSSPLWQPLSKLSYIAYIIHVFIQSINGRRMRTSTFFSDYDVMLNFWSSFGFVLLLSYVLYIVMEAPFGVLESMLMPNRRPTQKPNVPIEPIGKTIPGSKDETQLNTEIEKPAPTTEESSAEI